MRQDELILTARECDELCMLSTESGQVGNLNFLAVCDTPSQGTAGGETLLALGVAACVLGGAVGLDSNFHPFQNNLAQEGQEAGDVGTHSSLFVTFVTCSNLKKKKKAFGTKFDLNITPLAPAFLH